MKKIGLVSDTHGFWDTRLETYFEQVDEIWHAGDIGSIETYQAMEHFRPVRAVYGNIDGQAIRGILPLHQRFTLEGLTVWITHIGGYPGNYDYTIRDEMLRNPPGLFISGHSHICKVMPDKSLGLLHINPGAAGLNGFHQVRTAIRFAIENGRVTELEVIELGKRA